MQAALPVVELLALVSDGAGLTFTVVVYLAEHPVPVPLDTVTV